MRKHVLLVASLLLCITCIFAKTIPVIKQPSAATIAFTENKGQVHDQHYKPRPDVLFGVMAGNMAVHIKNTGVSYQLYRNEGTKEKGVRKQSHPDVNEPANLSASVPPRLGVEMEQTLQTIYRIDLTWLNANKNFEITKDETLPGYNNYYFENCPNGALNVKSYTGITLHNLYNGINLHYYQKNGELKHDYIVAPHSDYKQIQLQVEGAEITVNKDGSLLLATPLGQIQEGAPLVYQNGRQLKARWLLNKTAPSSALRLRFEIENYNPNYELIIDPVTRIWGTYYGGTGGEEGLSSATDVANNVYMAGRANSTGTIIATAGAHQTVFGGVYDALLVKFNSNGVRLWGTYYGGAGDESGNSCATDATGNIYLAGYTDSNTGTVIATPGSHQPAYGGGSKDAFLVKFNSSGLRQWGTYYGGGGADYAYSCSLDPLNNVYFSGQTSSTTTTIIATSGVHQLTNGGGSWDAFLVKFNSSGIRQWGTYYGGILSESGNSCSSDASGNVYMVGETTSSTGTAIASPGSHQPLHGGSVGDAFLVKFNSNGIRLWGTYYGGTGDEWGNSCAIDISGNIFMVGYTDTNTSTTIATPGSHQTNFGSGANFDAFLVKFDAAGVRQWGTYYGGTAQEIGYSCTTDIFGNVYLAGETATGAGTIIATTGSHQTTFGGGVDAFLAKFNSAGVRQWGTYYGGNGADLGRSCTLDAIGNLYLAGASVSGSAIATPGAHQTTYGAGGSYDAFLVKFDVCDVAPAQPASIIGPTVLCAASVNSYSTALAYGANSYTWSLPSGWAGSSNSNLISTTAAASGVFTLVAGNACGVSPQQTLSVTVNPLPTVSVNNGSICAGASYTLVPTGAASYSFSGGVVVSPSVTSSYTVTGTSSLSCSNTVLATVSVNPLPTITVNSGVICLGQSFTLFPGGAATYTYSSGPVVSPIVTSTYSISGSSAVGCLSSNTALSTVTVSNIHPTISVNSGAICKGKSFTITPTGAGSYTVQGGNFIVTPVTNTTYSVVGSSTAGCLSTNTVVASVSVNPLPTISVISSSTLLCEGESATLTASGASTYTFNPGGMGASITVSPTTNTNYQITGTDANGCSSSTLFTQSVNECVGNYELITNNYQPSIFPNPTNSVLNIEVGSDSEITIFNSLGQLIYSAKLSPGTQQLNTESWAKGVYVVRASNSGSVKLLIE